MYVMFKYDGVLYISEVMMMQDLEKIRQETKELLLKPLKQQRKMERDSLDHKVRMLMFYEGKDDLKATRLEAERIVGTIIRINKLDQKIKKVSE